MNGSKRATKTKNRRASIESAVGKLTLVCVQYRGVSAYDIVSRIASQKAIYADLSAALIQLSPVYRIAVMGTLERLRDSGACDSQ